MGFLDSILGLFKRQPVQHALKWPLPEERFSAEVEDAEQVVGQLQRLGAKHVVGGEYDDVVYRKSFGEGVWAYFIVRTDKKTAEERLVFDGYMLQEEERLGIEVQSGYATAESLERLGYEKVLERSLTAWNLNHLGLGVNVYSVDDFGDFIEVAVPPTKLAKQREVQEKAALALFEKLQVPKEEVLPTDVITLQLAELEESQGEKEGVAEKGGPGGFGGEFKLGQ